MLTPCVLTQITIEEKLLPTTFFRASELLWHLSLMDSLHMSLQLDLTGQILTTELACEVLVMSMPVHGCLFCIIVAKK